MTRGEHEIAGPNLMKSRNVLLRLIAISALQEPLSSKTKSALKKLDELREYLSEAMEKDFPRSDSKITYYGDIFQQFDNSNGV